MEGSLHAFIPNPKVREKLDKFTFRKKMCSSMETGLVKISLPDGEKLDAAIVPVNIPVLLGMDAKHKYTLALDFEKDNLGGTWGWTLPLIYTPGHAFVLPDGPIPEFPIPWT